MSIIRTLLSPLTRGIDALRRLIHTEARAYVRRPVIALITLPYLALYVPLTIVVLLIAAVRGIVDEWEYRDPLQVFPALRDRWNGVGIRKAVSSHPCATCTCLTEDECRIS